MHWTEERTAKSRVGEELQKRGWTIFGYTPDRSDMQTDYYAPAHWEGIATNDKRPGVVLGVKVGAWARPVEGGPAFQATPKGKAWHVEKDGQIIATGTGLNRCAGHSTGYQREVARFCDAIEDAAARPGNVSHQNTSTSVTPRTVEQITIEHRDDGTWVFFPDKPEKEVRSRLKALGFWWKKEAGGWNNRNTVPDGKLTWLGAVEMAAPAAEPTPPESPLELARRLWNEHRPANDFQAKKMVYDYVPSWLKAAIPPLYSQDGEKDPVIWLKLFLVDSRWTFYATEYSAVAPDGVEDLMFGYLASPLGDDCDEWCYLPLEAVREMRSPLLRVPVERDLWWRPRTINGLLGKTQPEDSPPADDPIRHIESEKEQEQIALGALNPCPDYASLAEKAQAIKVQQGSPCTVVVDGDQITQVITPAWLFRQWQVMNRTILPDHPDNEFVNSIHNDAAHRMFLGGEMETKQAADFRRFCRVVIQNVVAGQHDRSAWENAYHNGMDYYPARSWSDWLPYLGNKVEKPALFALVPGKPIYQYHQSPTHMLQATRYADGKWGVHQRVEGRGEGDEWRLLGSGDNTIPYNEMVELLRAVNGPVEFDQPAPEYKQQDLPHSIRLSDNLDITFSAFGVAPRQGGGIETYPLDPKDEPSTDETPVMWLSQESDDGKTIWFSNDQYRIAAEYVVRGENRYSPGWKLHRRGEGDEWVIVEGEKPKNTDEFKKSLTLDSAIAQLIELTECAVRIPGRNLPTSYKYISEESLRYAHEHPEPEKQDSSAALPAGWAADDIRCLLQALERSGPIVIAETELGIPSLDSLQRAGRAEHQGWGEFKIETATCTLLFDAGKSMQRTPSGRGYSFLTIKGDYPYDADAVRAKLESWLQVAEAQAQAAAPDAPAAPRKPQFGDWVKTPDGKIAQMRGSGGMGSNRVRGVDRNGRQVGFYDRDELVFVSETMTPELEAEIDEALFAKAKAAFDAALSGTSEQERRQAVRGCGFDAATFALRFVRPEENQPLYNRIYDIYYGYFNALADQQPFSTTLEVWLDDEHHETQRSGGDMYYIRSNGERTLWAGTTSRYEVIARQHYAEVQRCLIDGRSIAVDVLRDYPDLFVKATKANLVAPANDEQYRPVWERLPRDYYTGSLQRQKFFDIVVRLAVERGAPVPQRVLEFYPDLQKNAEASTPELPAPAQDNKPAEAGRKPGNQPDQPTNDTPQYSDADVSAYTTHWDVYFETGSLATVRKTVQRIDSIGLLRVAYERAGQSRDAQSVEERRKIILGRIRKLEKAA